MLTPTERTRAAAMLAELHAAGYRDATHKLLQPGARVRHTGHQYPEAFRIGTGTVLHVTEKPDSAWSLTYGAPDIELIVLWDTTRSLSQVANYHVDLIAGADTVRMWYLHVIIGCDDNTTYVDGYVLNTTRPSAHRWMRQGARLPRGYRILETSVKVCPAINWSLIG